MGDRRGVAWFGFLRGGCSARAGAFSGQAPACFSLDRVMTQIAQEGRKPDIR